MTCLAALILMQTALPPAPLLPLPSERQLLWQKMETYAFVHFGPNTFTDLEWGHGNEHESVFSPTNLDCRQWTHTLKAAGFKGVIITAKHHDGFCLWPSKLSTHTIAQSPWRDGKGDILKELSEACHADGLKFGVYLSPWDRNHPAYGTPEYNHVFEGMLREVLTHYGPIFEVWFDGANGEGPNGKKQVYDWPAFIGTVRELQPNAVIFSDSGPDVRWVGNEAGTAAPTCWATIDRDRYHPGTPLYTELTEGKEDGRDWVPAECDVSIRPGWFNHAAEDGKVRSPENLVRLWEDSVGQNASLNLNIPPNREGRISEPDIAALLGWRRLMIETYGHDLARGAHVVATDVRGPGAQFSPERLTDGKGGSYWAANEGVTRAELTFDLHHPKTFDRIELREPIQLGQRISKFTVEKETSAGWAPLAQGTTVGNRRVLRVPPTTAQRLRVVISDARACPALASFSLYKTPTL